MYANTCWGLLGTAIALGIAVLSLPPNYFWLRPWLATGAIICLAASIVCFLWPLMLSSKSSLPIFGVILGAAILFVSAVALVFSHDWSDASKKELPKNAGVLRPSQTKTFIANGTQSANVRIEVGRSGIILNDRWGLSDMLEMWGKDQFTIAVVEGQLKVSTTIRDIFGNIIAELQQNEWKVSAPPAWDRNYTDDSLEVKDAKGNIVLQVRVLNDVVQLQGAWWQTLANHQRLQMILRETPANELPPNNPNDGNRRIMMANGGKYAAQIVFHPQGAPWPEIQPMFRYPSDNHLGELLK